MRKATVPVLGLALLWALTGCGGTGGDGGSSSSPAQSSAAASSASATPEPSSTEGMVGTSAAGAGSTGQPMPTDEAAASGTVAGSDPSADQQCSGLSAADATAQHLAELPSPDAMGGTWSATPVDASAYDDCAALAAVTVGLEGSTGSAPENLMLFSHGKYLGTATERDYPFTPTVERVSDNTLRVTYHWTSDQDANASPSQTAVSQFVYDESTGKVTRTGDLPER